VAGSTRIPRRVLLVKVHIFFGGTYQGTECFVQPKILIGRGAEADLVLPSDTISRLHTAVVTASGGLVVEDLGSRNGTFKNGAAIGKAVLDVRDELAIGPYVLKLQLLDQVSGREIGLDADERRTETEIAIAPALQQAYEKSIFSPPPAETERAHKGEAHRGSGKFNGKRTTTKVTEAPDRRIRSKTEGQYRRGN
jgi:pSer/pThr/pTyr-binding forkhead associated (FHA) protein